MEKKEFIEIFKEELEIERNDISEETNLNTLENWDSMAYLVIIAFADSHFGVKLKSQQLTDLKKIKDIMKLVGIF